MEDVRCGMKKGRKVQGVRGERENVTPYALRHKPVFYLDVGCGI
jgi:hypothetical protein